MMLDLSIFRLAGASASHATQRQALISENVAHADTPGYRARDLKDFVSVYGGRIDGFDPRATRAGHMAAPARGPAFTADPVISAATGAASPNANTVSLEDQMLRGVDAQRQHDMAMAVYAKAVGILKMGFSRGR